jgi:hypothetical protein
MKSILKKIFLAAAITQINLAFADVYVNCQQTPDDKLTCPVSVQNESKEKIYADYDDASGYHSFQVEAGKSKNFQAIFDVTKFHEQNDVSNVIVPMRIFSTSSSAGCLNVLSVRNQPNFPRGKFFGTYTYMTPFGGGGCGIGGGEGLVLSYL